MAKSLLAGIILSCSIATSGWAATPSPSLIATPPQPKWSELTVEQKIVLAPLSDDWDSLEYYRQKIWIGIIARFPTMTPQEQRRVQVQMQEWGKLSPEQRQAARENFKTASQLPLAKKQELKQKWEEYSSLPEEEKQKLKLQAQRFTSTPLPAKSGRSSTTASLLSKTAASAAPTDKLNPSGNNPPPGQIAPARPVPVIVETATP